MIDIQILINMLVFERFFKEMIQQHCFDKIIICSRPEYCNCIFDRNTTRVTRVDVLNRNIDTLSCENTIMLNMIIENTNYPKLNTEILNKLRVDQMFMV